MIDIIIYCKQQTVSTKTIENNIFPLAYVIALICF